MCVCLTGIEYSTQMHTELYILVFVSACHRKFEMRVLWGVLCLALESLVFESVARTAAEEWGALFLWDLGRGVLEFLHQIIFTTLNCIATQGHLRSKYTLLQQKHH